MALPSTGLNLTHNLPAAMRFIQSTSQERAQALDSSVWSKGLGWDDIERLANYAELWFAPAGTVLCKEGDPGLYMALILAGEIQVKKEKGGVAQVLTTIGIGRTFGEMSLVDGQPRSATILVLKDTKLFILTPAALERISEEVPRLALKLMRRITHLISQRLRQTSGRLAEANET